MILLPPDWSPRFRFWFGWVLVVMASMAVAGWTALEQGWL